MNKCYQFFIKNIPAAPKRYTWRAAAHDAVEQKFAKWVCKNSQLCLDIANGAEIREVWRDN